MKLIVPIELRSKIRRSVNEFSMAVNTLPRQAPEVIVQVICKGGPVSYFLVGCGQWQCEAFQI
jgi:hypothetical protein